MGQLPNKETQCDTNLYENVGSAHDFATLFQSFLFHCTITFCKITNMPNNSFVGSGGKDMIVLGDGGHRGTGYVTLALAVQVVSPPKFMSITWSVC